MSEKTKTTNAKTKKENLAALELPALFAHLGAHDGRALHERGHHGRLIREGWLSGVEAARVRP